MVLNFTYRHGNKMEAQVLTAEQEQQALGMALRLIQGIQVIGPKQGALLSQINDLVAQTGNSLAIKAKAIPVRKEDLGAVSVQEVSADEPKNGC